MIKKTTYLIKFSLFFYCFFVDSVSVSSELGIGGESAVLSHTGSPSKRGFFERSKPSTQSALDWIKGLQSEVDKIDQDEDPINYMALRREICQTIAGKYGISRTPATGEERDYIFSVIQQTRQNYPGMFDILGKLYFRGTKKSWDVLSTDVLYAAHMSVVVAVDALQAAALQKSTENVVFKDFVEDSSVDSKDKDSQKLLSEVKNLISTLHEDEHAPILEKIIDDHLKKGVWHAIVTDVKTQMEVMPPKLTLSCEFSDKSHCHWTLKAPHGWALRSSNGVSQWFESGDTIQNGIKGVCATIFKNDSQIIMPLCERAIKADSKLTSSIMEQGYRPQKEMRLAVVPYAFFLPVVYGGITQSTSPEKPIVFYLTKEVSRKKQVSEGIHYTRKLKARTKAWKAYVKSFYVSSYEEERKYLEEAIQGGLVRAFHGYADHHRGNALVVATYLEMGADRGEINALGRLCVGGGLRDPNGYIKIATNLIKERKTTWNYWQSRKHFPLDVLERLANDETFEEVLQVLQSLSVMLGFSPESNLFDLMDGTFSGTLSGSSDKLLNSIHRLYKMTCRLFQDSGLQVIPWARYTLACEYDQVGIYLEKVRSYYEFCAKQLSYAPAYRKYGIMCYLGHGGPEDYAEARHALQIASSQHFGDKWDYVDPRAKGILDFLMAVMEKDGRPALEEQYSGRLHPSKKVEQGVTAKGVTAGLLCAQRQSSSSYLLDEFNKHRRSSSDGFTSLQFP